MADPVTIGEKGYAVIVSATDYQAPVSVVYRNRLLVANEGHPKICSDHRGRWVSMVVTGHEHCLIVQLQYAFPVKTRVVGDDYRLQFAARFAIGIDGSIFSEFLGYATVPPECAEVIRRANSAYIWGIAKFINSNYELIMTKASLEREYDDDENDESFSVASVDNQVILESPPSEPSLRTESINIDEASLAPRDSSLLPEDLEPEHSTIYNYTENTMNNDFSETDFDDDDEPGVTKLTMDMYKSTKRQEPADYNDLPKPMGPVPFNGPAPRPKSRQSLPRPWKQSVSSSNNDFGPQPPSGRGNRSISQNSRKQYDIPHWQQNREPVIPTGGNDVPIGSRRVNSFSTTPAPLKPVLGPTPNDETDWQDELDVSLRTKSAANKTRPPWDGKAVPAMPTLEQNAMPSRVGDPPKVVKPLPTPARASRSSTGLGSNLTRRSSFTDTKVGLSKISVNTNPPKSDYYQSTGNINHLVALPSRAAPTLPTNFTVSKASSQRSSQEHHVRPPSAPPLQRQPSVRRPSTEAFRRGSGSSSSQSTLPQRPPSTDVFGNRLSDGSQKKPKNPMYDSRPPSADNSLVGNRPPSTLSRQNSFGQSSGQLNLQNPTNNDSRFVGPTVPTRPPSTDIFGTSLSHVNSRPRLPSIDFGNSIAHTNSFVPLPTTDAFGNSIGHGNSLTRAPSTDAFGISIGHGSNHTRAPSTDMFGNRLDQPGSLQNATLSSVGYNNHGNGNVQGEVQYQPQYDDPNVSFRPIQAPVAQHPALGTVHPSDHGNVPSDNIMLPPQAPIPREPVLKPQMHVSSLMQIIQSMQLRPLLFGYQHDFIGSGTALTLYKSTHILIFFIVQDAVLAYDESPRHINVNVGDVVQGKFWKLFPDEMPAPQIVYRPNDLTIVARSSGTTNGDCFIIHDVTLPYRFQEANIEFSGGCFIFNEDYGAIFVPDGTNLPIYTATLTLRFSYFSAGDITSYWTVVNNLDPNSIAPYPILAKASNSSSSVVSGRDVLQNPVLNNSNRHLAYCKPDPFGAMPLCQYPGASIVINSVPSRMDSDFVFLEPEFD